jgi:DAACS family dicarboxylate/amino acid:cation (Na+ or H+) symporter
MEQKPDNLGAASPWSRCARAYRRTPLYLKILVGLVLGVIVGVILNAAIDRAVAAGAEAKSTAAYRWAVGLNEPAKLILRLLSAIAPPLILVAVIRALVTAEVHGRLAGRMAFLLLLNTAVAIGIGLLVANVVRPGAHAHLKPLEAKKISADPVQQLLDNIPNSLLQPLVDSTKVIGVIMIAVAFGLAARRLAADAKRKVIDAIQIGFDLILIVLHWVIALVPLAVFGKVAYTVGVEGFGPFKALAWFILAVIVALALHATYYLVRIRLGSWVRPAHLIRGTRDALVMAFSTASSTATMPVTYECLRARVGLRDECASLGALVGSNFNNDGTALYEAMSALFVAQMIGQELSIVQQLMVVLTSVVASVGAAGIPEAGLVTMTLVFNAVGLPTGFIALLLPVDWFLDRCRTAINIMGDMNVACLLEGRRRTAASVTSLPESAAAVGTVTVERSSPVEQST